MSRLIRDEGGYSLVELIAVLGTLGAVVGAITSLFVSGSRAQLDLSTRFEAQTDARAALDRLRRDVHTACSATPAGASSSVTLRFGSDPTDPLVCTEATEITWCTVASGSSFNMNRLLGPGNCATAGRAFARNLTAGSIFNYQAPSTDNLGKLQATISIRLGQMQTPFQLCDVLVLRNTSRVGNPGATVACP